MNNMEGFNIYMFAPTSTFLGQGYNSITMYNIKTNYLESVETGLTFQMDTKYICFNKIRVSLKNKRQQRQISELSSVYRRH